MSREHVLHGCTFVFLIRVLHVKGACAASVSLRIKCCLLMLSYLGLLYGSCYDHGLWSSIAPSKHGYKINVSASLEGLLQVHL